ncbi:MAG: cupin domain-containing protein [Chthoniobacterales bacterium]
MRGRAKELISELSLEPHPEGGHFREIFRSSSQVQPLDERPARSALTTIYFLLTSGQHSRWHRVASDEAWHFYEGDPLELYWIGPNDEIHEELLTGVSSEGRPVCVVPAGCWQAAKPRGEYSLVGCTVGPGFEFEDFEMLSGGSAEFAHITSLRAAFAEFA